jgi:hypothetical protein
MWMVLIEKRLFKFFILTNKIFLKVQIFPFTICCYGGGGERSENFNISENCIILCQKEEVVVVVVVGYHKILIKF